MDDQQKQLIAKLKGTQNVLVTVSKDPSVDQLSAAIALTLALNKLCKHATAVYSGQTPSTIEFLKPEETLETNTDSLRDFIIALDKSKADKLRYKVEDQVVRIFITPYKTSISENDLDFSQGDFNVDVVVALGVQEQQDVDDAIQAHGRILHDAAISSISVNGQPELGTLNVVKPDASSLSEVVTQLIEQLDGSVIDGQIATALLTGIVATTERFSNDRTSPDTMTVSARLMSAGANQQLIVNELEKEEPEPIPDAEDDDPGDDPSKGLGTLEIDHTGDVSQSHAHHVQVDEDGTLIMEPEEMLPPVDRNHDVQGEAEQAPEEQQEVEQDDSRVASRERMIDPPSRDGKLTANVQEEQLDAPAEALTLPSSDTPFLTHQKNVEQAEMTDTDVTADTSPAPESAQDNDTQDAVPQPDFLASPNEPSFVVPPVEPAPLAPANVLQSSPAVPQPVAAPDINTNGKTLSDLEKEVHSSHAEAETPSTVPPVANVEDARSAVEAALKASSRPLEPITAPNAQPLGAELHDQPAPVSDVPNVVPAGVVEQPVEDTLAMPLPGQMPQPVSPSPASAFPGSMPPSGQDNNSLPPPPPVPPPPIIPS